MIRRKKKILDGIDKEILRLLLVKRPLVSRKIANYVGITPSAVMPRLCNMESLGIIKKYKVHSMRFYTRKFENFKLKIKSPRYILWDLNLKK
ncbi:MAG: winged helix-turn-helix transcriptional regulator [Candidatus Pacearchaeota archaeon]